MYNEFYLLTKKIKTMRNLMLTFCLSFIISITYGQIKVVAPDGDVGIGISTPTEKLDVNGNVKVRDNIFIGENAGTGEAYISVGEGRSENGRASFKLIADAEEYDDWGFRFVRFANGYTNLDHRGSNNLVFNNVDGAATYFSVSDNAKMSIEDNQIQSMVQAYKLGGGPWAATSDGRLKKDVNEYKKGLKEILSINPVSYKYNKEIVDLSDETYVGVIAQEVQEIVPSMVKEHEFTDKSAKTYQGYLSVDPNEFTYMLINAVKELEQQVKELSQEVKDLKSEPSIISSVIEGGTRIAYLAQNAPNPIIDATKIEYYIPNEANSAFLIIHNMAGQLIKKVDVTDKGLGLIDLKLKGMPPGVYSYALNIDGNIIDTKKMTLR